MGDKTFDPRRLLDVVPQLVWSADAEGIGDYANGPLLAYLGKPLSELADYGWLGIVHPDDVERARSAWTETVREGHNATCELRVRRASDGAYRWCLATVLAERNGSGRPLRWYGTLADVNERKSAQAHLGALLEQLPVGVVVADTDTGRIVLANPAAATILGRPVYPGQGIEECHDRGLEHVDGRPYAAPEHPLARAIRGETITGEELSIPDGANGHRSLSINAAPIRDGADVRAGVAVFTDITSRRCMEQTLSAANERLARNNAELEHFAFAVSHDLKAPLRAVSSLAGCLEEVLGDRGDGEADALLREMQVRVKRMGEMIDGLLGYARTGRQQPSCEPVDVGALVAEVAASLDIPPGFDVRFTGGPLTLCIARLHLQQILQNLIGNAVRHHDQDAGRITVSAVRQGDRWQFHVVDDGPGIAADERERVFEMFATVPGSRNEGSGLGLAIVKKLLHDVGGAVSIGEAEPRGTAVMFDWPVWGIDRGELPASA